MCVCLFEMKWMTERKTKTDWNKIEKDKKPTTPRLSVVFSLYFLRFQRSWLCLCDDLCTCLPIKLNYDGNIARFVNCTHRRLYSPLEQLYSLNSATAHSHENVHNVNWVLTKEENEKRKKEKQNTHTHHRDNKNENKFPAKSMNNGNWKVLFGFSSNKT